MHSASAIRVATSANQFISWCGREEISASMPLASHSYVLTTSFRRHTNGKNSDAFHIVSGPETACLTGKSCLPFDQTIFRGDPFVWREMHSTPQLATLHYQHAELEYETKQAVSSLSLMARQDTFTPLQTAHRLIWKMLARFAELAETIEVDVEQSHSSASPMLDRSCRVLMDYKLLIRVYSIFPRALFLDDSTHRCSTNWVNSALPMASHALKLYHICWLHFGWLGDCILDAQHFIELLCRYVLSRND